MSQPSSTTSRRAAAARYQRVLRLASGGMATVDLAIRREGTFVRLHAIKRLHPHLLEDADVRAMFLEEARIAGLLRHSNVVSVAGGSVARGTACGKVAARSCAPYRCAYSG